jgi:leucyl aminopeptidase
MIISVLNASITDIECDAIVVNLFQGVAAPGGATGAVDRALDGLLSRLIREEGFEGKPGQTLLVHTQGRLPAARVILTGLGEPEKLDLDTVRRASAAALRRARDARARRVATIVHGAGAGGMAPARAAQATVEGAVLGTYEFLKYKSEPQPRQIEELLVAEMDASRLPSVQAGVSRGDVVSRAVNLARDLVNSPANDITPSALALLATRVASETGLEALVLERPEAERLGMGCYLAVARGSQEAPKFITLRYRPEGEPAGRVAIIGKGVTFDSGGLSLKTAESMVTMKDDMSGAAAVLAAMQAVAELRPDREVLAIVPAVENMPSGSAMRPGDVVCAMNGKTIEIENTDAEGRLTLADALCYAAREGCEELIDLATLTGACVWALGRVYSGVMSNNQDLVERLKECSRVSGDRIWQLPLSEDYRYLIESQVADMKNTGGREGGAITAALLLSEFTEGRPWAHIDIAGPAFLSQDNGVIEKGASGAGVRLLIEYLCGEPAA